MSKEFKVIESKVQPNHKEAEIWMTPADKDGTREIKHYNNVSQEWEGGSGSSSGDGGGDGENNPSINGNEITLTFNVITAGEHILYDSDFDSSQIKELYIDEGLTELTRKQTFEVGVHKIRFVYENLTNLDYLCWNIADGTSGTALVAVDMSKCDTSKVTSMNQMIYGAWGIITIDMSNCDLSSCDSFNECFFDVPYLAEIKLGKNIKSDTDFTKMFCGLGGTVIDGDGVLKGRIWYHKDNAYEEMFATAPDNFILIPYSD